MDTGINVQKRFFAELKSKLPSNLSMARVVAEELSISIDSAYRRIRGESDLSLAEFDLLMSKYAISTEAILSRSFDSIHFDYHALNANQAGFEEYFKYISEHLKSLSNFGLQEIVYIATDLPIFYFFMYPKLASFKLYFWRNKLKSIPGEKHSQFDPRQLDGLLEKSHKLLRAYLEHPTIEIWDSECLRSTMRQILYCHQKGMFESKQDIIDILEELKKVIVHIEKQAELGFKFYPGNTTPTYDKSRDFRLYCNVVSHSENLILVKLEHFELAHLTHNTLNILTTNNEDFYMESRSFADHLINKSTLMSSDTDRKLFFNGLYHKIDTLSANL